MPPLSYQYRLQSYPHPQPQPQPRPRAPTLHITFLSYADALGPPRLRVPTLLTINCLSLHAPSFRLQKRYTGLDRPLAAAVFARSRNEDAYQRALDRIFAHVRHYWTTTPCSSSSSSERGAEREGEVAILVKCVRGMHRSVAMAERLAGEVGRWRGVRVSCEHLDLGEAVGGMVERGYGPYRRWWRGG